VVDDGGMEDHFITSIANDEAAKAGIKQMVVAHFPERRPGVCVVRILGTDDRIEFPGTVATSETQLRAILSDFFAGIVARRQASS
jgi:hypothetical protein